MSPCCFVWTKHLRRFPRVSGDEPLIDLINHDQEAFSPRERG